MPSHKPAIVKTAVLAKHLNGVSITQIANDLDITRPTVNRILNESEIDTLIKQAQGVLVSESPAMAQTVVNKAKKNAHFGLGILRSLGVINAEPKANDNNGNTNALQVIFQNGGVYQDDNKSEPVNEKVITVSPSTSPDQSPSVSPSADTPS